MGSKVRAGHWITEERERGGLKEWKISWNRFTKLDLLDVGVRPRPAL